MARELRLYREIERREAARQAGRNPHSPYHLLIHAQGIANEIDTMALPEDTANATTCQFPDGSFHFMVGFSDLDGPDALA